MDKKIKIDTISLRLQGELAVEIETYMADLQRDMPPGVKIRKSDVIRALLMEALEARRKAKQGEHSKEAKRAE